MRKTKLPTIYYGWWVVIAAFLISVYAGGAVIFGFTAIFEPIADEFGWSYANISLASSLRGIEIGLLAPLVGILVDRWGPRRLLFGGAILVALGLFTIGRTTSLAIFYGGFGILAVGMSALVSTVLITAVNNWFRVKAGMVTGIALSGYGFSGLMIPLIVKLVDLHGWRTTLSLLALGMLVIVLPLSLVFRHKPENYGLTSYGEAPIDSSSNTAVHSSSPAPEIVVSSMHVIKSKTFWHLGIAFVFQFMAVSSITLHVMPYLSSVGIARSVSSFVGSALPLVGITGRLSSGWLVDKFSNQKIASMYLVMASLGLLCFALVPTIGAWLIVRFTLLFAISTGGITVLRASLTRHFFGRNRFGSIFGLMTGMTMIGSVIGPPLAGRVFDTWGSYEGMWFALAVFVLISMISLATTPPFSALVQPDE